MMPRLTHMIKIDPDASAWVEYDDSGRFVRIRALRPGIYTITSALMTEIARRVAKRKKSPTSPPRRRK